MPRRLHRLGLAAAHHKWVFLLLWLVAIAIFLGLYHAAGSNTSNNHDLPGTDSQAVVSGERAATDYGALEMPAVIRRNRATTVEALQQSGMEKYDIPAFLRKQAD